MVKFTEVKVTNIENEVEVIDLSKQIGNTLYTQGKDVSICECGKKIYYGEEVELTEEQKAFIRQSIEQFPYIFKKAIEEML